MCHLNFSFGSYNTQMLGGNWEVEKEMNMTSWNGFWKLLTLIYEIPWKTTLNEGIKNFEIGFKIQKKNLDFPKTFDNPFAKYLISKVSWMNLLYF